MWVWIGMYDYVSLYECMELYLNNYVLDVWMYDSTCHGCIGSQYEASRGKKKGEANDE